MRNELAKRRDERGFTLIELLIVVVIIGILAAIAIPQFTDTKDQAYVSQVKSDLRNAMTAMETEFVSNDNTYPANGENPDYLTRSDNVTLTVTAAGDADGYCIEGVHDVEGTTYAVASGADVPDGQTDGVVFEGSCS